MAIVLCFAMVLSTMSFNVFAIESTVGTEAELKAALAEGGSGTEEDIILINTAEDLIALRDAVNSGDNYAGKYVKLNADIDLSSVDNWTPIGDVLYNSNYAPADTTKVFSGTFDGNDKVISNLKIEKFLNDAEEGPDADANLGLFGIIGEGAVIKDLTITNVDITTDGRNVGALAGVAYKATLDNITVNGDIQITGGNNVCGVCAMTRYYDVSATNITVSGEEGSYINGNNIVAGMFAEIAPNGSNQTFENLSVENVAINGVGGVGGIVGLLTNGSVSNVSVKNVELVGNTAWPAGGEDRIRIGSIAGLLGSNNATISGVTVENVTAKNLDDEDVILPVVGANYGASSNATEAKIGDTYYATLAKAFAAAVEGDTVVLLCDIENVIEIPDGVALDKNGYRFGDSLTGMGTEEDPYLINNIDDLVWFRNDVNAGNTYEGKYVALKADINLTGEVWTPIGTSIYDKTPADSDVKMFAGNFDGENHTITGLSSNGYVPASSETESTEYSFGLFGYVYGANISNVKLADVDIEGTTRQDSDGNNVGGSGVAALIGYYYVADGKECVIENCHVLSGTVSASNNMGGLIGFVDSQVSTPQNVDISIINCSNAADVTSEAREAGGIVGLLNASREDYSPTMAGNITFKGCVNTGDITTLAGGGSTFAGGILGKDQNEYSNQQLKITFDDCENSGTITVNARGETHVAGIASSLYSHGAWLVVKNSKNTGNIVVVNPENADPLYVGGLLGYAGVMDVIESTSTGAVTVGTEAGNKYIGNVQNMVFVDGIDDFNTINTGDIYYLNGGASPEFEALVDDVANWGGNFNVIVKKAYKDGFEFGGWYDNKECTGTPVTAVAAGSNTYYAKWIGTVATIERGGTVVEYNSLNEAFAEALEGETITLLDDATPALISQRAITKASVIDLNGKTLKLTEDDLYFGTTTFKNGKIVVAPSVSASTAVIWMFENQTLTFDNVDIIATGVTGTYLIGINGGTGSAVNLMNESSITIDNASVASLTAVICDNGTGNAVTIDNADIDVKNIEGRFYLGGENGTISVNNSDIDLNGVKEGFYLRAGQNLSIEGTSTVDVTLNDTQGRWGINITDATATYNKADTATVNASDNIPHYVAFIGTTGYETVAGAITAAQANDTITLVDNVTEDVTIGKNITLDGNDKTYTGTMTLSSAITATIENVNFVNGWITKDTKSTKGNYTIKNCTFDGEGARDYSLRFKGAASITVENCDVKDYKYSFLYVSAGTNIVSVKDVTVDGCANYGIYFASGVNDATIEGLTVKNSIAGLVINNEANRALTLKDCTFESVEAAVKHSKATRTITTTLLGDNNFGTAASDEYAKFVLAEGAELTAANVFDVTTNVEGNFAKYADGKYKSVKAVAQIGEAKYDSLAEAIAVGGDVVLLTDIELVNTITVKNDVSLDLNGKTISGNCTGSQAHMFMVNNGAELTIKDSSDAKTGKITYNGTDATGWIVDVEGALVLESGTLELTGTWNIGYAVDVRPNAWGTAYTEGTAFVMNGGKIVSSDGAVRVASSSADTYKDVSASFTMNGGEIEAAWDGVFVQQSNAAWDVLNVTINNGTIKSALNPIRFYGPAATSYVNGEDCVDIALNGGTLTYTGTEAREWLVDGILRLGGGVTADAFMKDCDVTASADFATTNVADGYSWVSIGRKYRLQTLGEYSFVVESSVDEIIDSGDFTVYVKVSSEKVDNFHSSEYIVTYDPNLLTCAEDNGSKDFDSATGTLRLQCLEGANVNEVIDTLNFTTKEFYLTQETEIKVSGIVCATQYDAATGTSEPVSDGAVVILLKDSFNVTVGAGLEGASVAYNKTDYVVSIAAENQGKQNTIKYTINDANGNPVENTIILPAGTNEYTISGDDIIGDMTFEISDAYSIEIITDYVTGYALILVDGSADGYTYNGHQMLKINRDSGSFEYNGRYGWLVDGSAPGTTLESVEAAAYAAIRAGEESKAVETGYDVNSYINGDGKINFYDVSAAYACQKIDFALSDVDDYFYMELYLASDANCDGKVDSSDSAIISVNYNN